MIQDVDRDKVSEHEEHIHRYLSPVLHYDEVQEIMDVIIKVLDAKDETISEEKKES